MDAATKADFVTELRRMQSKLRLSNWSISVEFVDSLIDSWAEVRRNGQANEAEMEVASSLLEESMTRQRYVMIHELLHLHTRDMIRQLQLLLESLDLTTQWREHVTKAMELQEELLVDRLARALEPLL